MVSRCDRSGDDNEDPNQLAYFHDGIDTSLKPLQLLLKDGTPATLFPVYSPDQVPLGLLAHICDEFNIEIERGETYPIEEPLQLDTFRHYWFGSFAAILLIGHLDSIHPDTNWSGHFLGTFYVKPNYPGRCSHVCNAGFLVNGNIRGKGTGRALAQVYLQWAPKLGYTYSVFNLVFDTNIASKKIWDDLGFEKIGKVKGAGRLKGHEKLVDAIIYGKELIEPAY